VGEQVKMNTICPECGGEGEVRVARAIVRMASDGPGPAGTALVAVTCKTCQGDGKLTGFQPPV
jgi:DnaJ-class molecular chaperone